MDEDDERYVELETLEAIFPEIHKLGTGKMVSFSIDVPVHPARPVNVIFPAASDPAALAQEGTEPRLDSRELAYLPPVTVHISLPEGYPADKPPIFDISSSPAWLPPAKAQHMEEEGLRMWEDMGHSLVAYDFIDHIQQKADSIFDMIDASNTLKIDPVHQIAILDYDIKARKAAYDRETFDCGVCIEPKKGAACHKMIDCGHVFCKACLQDFYNNAITEGDLSVVRCLFPDCAKKRAAASDPKKRKAKTHINPSELLLMGVSQEMVARYINLKYKNELESDKNTIYCPRSWCNGAARSKKHKKPRGLELDEPSDDESDDEKAGGDTAKDAVKKPFDANELLSICEDCGLAFCSRCLQSWHGEFVRCAPRRDKEEITEEEQASIDYLKLYTSPCPTCAAPVQKTHGCNHMICFRCRDHFCYLCSSWLDPANPYKHYNNDGGTITGCYMRLFDLERGDGDVFGHFDAENAGLDLHNIDEDDFDGEEARPVAPAPGPPAAPAAAAEAVAERAPVNNGLAAGAAALEAPLVLRIGGDLMPRGGRGGPNVAAPAPRGGGVNGARGGGGRGAGNPRGGAHARAVAPQPRGVGGGELNPQQGEWVRNFIRLALLDEEDSDEGDGDHWNDEAWDSDNDSVP